MRNCLNYHSDHFHRLVHHTTTFQKYIFKSKTLNRTDEIPIYLNFNQLLEFSNVRKNNMCDNFYFRITNTNVLPTYLFWHIVQDFHNDDVRRLAGRDYLSLRHFIDHIVYISGKPLTLLSIGQFVKHRGQANLRIGKYPHNFGEVELLNNNFIHQVRKNR